MYATPLNTLIFSLYRDHYLHANDTQLFFFFFLLPPANIDSNITHLHNAVQQFSSWMTIQILPRLITYNSKCSVGAGL